ncbi:MAG TPA: lantibiotic dehydratase [Candidatus Angelobacter sp.]|nr:lantibiotic dehydratase [Candidatus Angelobacter sp.]
MKEFTTSGFFVLRTPLLPIEDFLAFSDGLSVSKTLCNGGDLAAAGASDRKLLRTRLREFAERAEVKEALWLASPDFFALLATWRRDPESEKGQRLERALYRYMARMTSRATPFGLFAGCSVGAIGTTTRLEIGPRTEYRRRSRLDMEYLCNLAQKISFDPVLQLQLSFRPNSSLYLAAGRYHHAQSYLTDNVRSYRLIGTDETSYLTDTLKQASAGASVETLASALTKDSPAITTDEAREFIQQLIQSQLLISDLVPPITGAEPMDDMLARLEGEEFSPLRTKLCAVIEDLYELDRQGVGNDPFRYEEIVNQISRLPAEFKSEHLVQVDMVKPAENAYLSQQLVEEILHAVEALHTLSSSAPDPLREFKDDFRDRYQDQEVPLMMALDDEVGIGFDRNHNPTGMPEALIQDLNVRGRESKIEIKATEREFILMRKLEELARRKDTVLELEAKFQESLHTEPSLPLPDAFAVMGTLVRSPGSGAQAKWGFYLQSASGPSGANLLGRFCHADHQLTACVRNHLRAEEARAGGKAVFAEIAHFPEGRVGNILCRPWLREYEIPFLATSRAHQDRQIDMSDLMISVVDDRIVLRSQRLGREVLPRLTSAHAYTRGGNLKLYKFLCLLQHQGVAGSLGWNWGILEQASFLPRVVKGNIILAAARWRMDKDLIEKLAGRRGPDRLRALHEWRIDARVPRFVLLADADNRLLIDFDNVLSVETLIEFIKRRERALLLEMLPGPDSLCAYGPEGSFTHEVVIPLVRAKEQPVAAGLSNASARHAIASRSATVIDRQRSFIPGSEWLFAKIYASPAQVDRLLIEDVQPLIQEVLASGDADGWFFIRYADPQWHLRLRFRGNPKTLGARLLPQLWERLDRQQHARVWRVQLDTYEREVERYGGLTGVCIAERLFQLDSELVLALLSAIADRLNTSLRWRLGFLTVDTLLSSLGLDPGARLSLVNNLGKAHEQKFSLDQRYKDQLAEKFRSEREQLEALLNDPSQGEVPSRARLALSRFAQGLEAARVDLERAQQAGELNKSVAELAGSYVHMHLNRLFRSAANAQEMVLYDFLARTYRSRIARQKQRARSDASAQNR